MASLPYVVSFQSGRIRIDSAARIVIVGGQPAKLGGRAFDLLEALVARRHRMVPKQELLDVVWPGLIVEENNLQVHVVTLRKLLGAQSIVTVQGRGYRFALAPDEGSSTSHLDRVIGGATSEFAERDAAPSTTLVGRESLIASVCSHMRGSDVRLLTLTGLGGSGKTRVALQVTAELAHDFADGSYVVMLAPVRDAAYVAAAIAAVLNVQEAGGRPAADLIVNHLRDRDVLLTLDNFEHVLSAAPLIASLMESCPRVKLLVTSRSILKLDAEHVVMVPPLRVPDRHMSSGQLSDSPAVRLFCNRAHATGRDIGDSAEDLKVVAEICRHLDGLPLAIELAAARLRVLTPRALSERLGSRLQMLKGGSEDLPARQKSLRNAIAWSYDLLGPDEQKVFRRLAVFVGGWTLEAAEAVAGSNDLHESVLDLLTSLIDHSLVQRVDDVDGEPRFAILETVREYGAERLEASDEAPHLRQRHFDHFLEFAERAESQLTSVQRKPWLVRLLADYNNLRAALSWSAVECVDGTAAVRLAGALPWMWYFAGRFSEGRGWIALVLGLPDADQRGAARAKLLSGAARLAIYSGAINDAKESSRESVALWRDVGDRRGLAFALVHQAIPLMASHQRQASFALMRESRDCFTELDDAWGIAYATTYMGCSLAYEQGAEDDARPVLVEGRARFRALGDEWGVTTSSHYLGSIALRQADYASARALTEEMLADSRDLGDNYRVSRNLHQLAEIALAENDLAQARHHLSASLSLNREQGRIGDAALQLRLLARIELKQDRPARAARLSGAASLHGGKERTLPPDDADANAATLAVVRQALGERHFESEWARGAAMSFDQAVTFAIDGDELINDHP